MLVRAAPSVGLVELVLLESKLALTLFVFSDVLLFLGLRHHNGAVFYEAVEHERVYHDVLAVAVEVRIGVDYVFAAAQAFEDVEIDVEITANGERPAAPVVPVEVPLVMKPPAEIRLNVLERNVPHFPVYGFVAEDSALVFPSESEEAAELDLLCVAGCSVYYGRIDSPEVFNRFVVASY